MDNIQRIEDVESKIADLVFASLPVVVIGMFGALGSLLLSKKHLSVRLFLGVFFITAVLILSTDMLAIDRGLSEHLRVFFAGVGGVFIKELAVKIREKYLTFLGGKG